MASPISSTTARRSRTQTSATTTSTAAATSAISARTSPSRPITDSDGDGVGDACDPRPNSPGDRIALWDGFYDANDIANWPPSTGATLTVSQGRLVVGSPTASFLYTFPPGIQLSNASAVTSVRVTAVGAATNGPFVPMHERQQRDRSGVLVHRVRQRHGQQRDRLCDFWPTQPGETTGVAWPGTFGMTSDV